MQQDSRQTTGSPDDAKELLFVPGGISVFVTQDHAEPALLEQGSLKIYDTPAGLKAEVGGVFWSLGRGTACVRITGNAFTFSVPESAGLYITIILPEGLDNEVLLSLVDVLASTTSYHDQRAARQATDSAVVASAPPATTLPQHPDGLSTDNVLLAKVITLSATAAKWVRYAGNAASLGLARGADYFVKTTAPAEQPVHVSSKTMKRLESYRRSAGRLASVTGTVVQKVAVVTVSMASGIASTVTDSYIAKRLDSGKVSELVAVGLSAVDEVFQAMEDAGLQVVETAATATTQVVNHRYGPEAAKAASLGMGTAVHVAEARYHLGKLRPTKIMKDTAKKVAIHTLTGGKVGYRPDTSGLGRPSTAPVSHGVVIEELDADDDSVPQHNVAGKHQGAGHQPPKQYPQYAGAQPGSSYQQQGGGAVYVPPSPTASVAEDLQTLRRRNNAAAAGGTGQSSATYPGSVPTPPGPYPTAWAAAPPAAPAPPQPHGPAYPPLNYPHQSYYPTVPSN